VSGRHRGLPIAAIAISVVLWSTAFALSGIVLQTSSPAVLSVARFAVALVVLVPLAARRRGFVRALRSPFTIVLGLTGVTFYYSLTNIGLLFTTAGTVALANALLPVFTTVLAIALLRERPSVRTVIGLVLATAGVALVAASGLHFDVGIVLVAIALASYSLYTVLLRRDAERTERADRPEALVLSTATAIWGTLLMLPWLAVEWATGGSHLPDGWAGIGSLLFLALIVTAPTLVLFNYGAERLPATISGIFVAGIPALGYAFAVVLGEAPVPIKVIGGVIALIGIVVATVSAPRVEPAPPGAPVIPPSDQPEPAEQL
jgi:drug/metabolite transporter (DMT)-like permease